MTSLHVHRLFLQQSPCAVRSQASCRQLTFARRIQRSSSNRAGPRFDSSRQPSAEELFREAKVKSSAQVLSQKSTDDASGAGRYAIRPWKLILISIAAYLGYRVYHWQTNPHRSLVLNGKYFTPFLLESKDRVSSTSTIFNLLSLPAGQNTYNIEEAWRLGAWSVQVMQPELQIARSYTPLPPNENTSPEEIRLLVRKEPQGEVSGFLHKISPGTIVHLRGPHPEYRIPDDVEEIVFLAGGTGITPALQIVHSLYTARNSSPEQLPLIRILWANRRREDSYAGLKPSPLETTRASIMAKVRAGLAFEDVTSPERVDQSASDVDYDEPMSEQSLLVEEVEAMKTRHGGKVKIDYFVDEENTFITEALLCSHLSRRVSQDDAQVSSRKRLVLVSGPEGFVNVLAGPKGIQKGRETQGQLGGILKEICPPDWEVWKL